MLLIRSKPLHPKQHRTVVAASGFTIPELISVMAITLIFSAVIMLFAFEYWRSSATLTNDLETFVGRLNASDKLREALNASSGMINQNSIADSHVNNPDTSIGSGLYWIPLHAIPGNTVMPSAGATTPILYYRAPSINTSKNVVMNGANPYEDEFVLYLDGSTKQLYLRTLANGSATANRLKPSCPPASATAACPADKVMAVNLASVDMRFFSRAGNTIDYHSVTDPVTGAYIGPDFPSVEVVEITLHTFQKSTLHGGADTQSQTIIRVALRNA